MDVNLMVRYDLNPDSKNQASCLTICYTCFDLAELGEIID